MSSGIQHSCCMLNRLSHCSVNFVRELRSQSDVSFVELLLMQPVIITQIADSVSQFVYTPHALLALALDKLRLSTRHALSLCCVAAVSVCPNDCVTFSVSHYFIYLSVASTVF